MQNFVLTPFGCGLCKRLLPPDFPTGSRVFFCPNRDRQHVLKTGCLWSMGYMEIQKADHSVRSGAEVEEWREDDSFRTGSSSVCMSVLCRIRNGNCEREHAVPEERCGGIRKTEIRPVWNSVCLNVTETVRCGGTVRVPPGLFFERDKKIKQLPYGGA